MRRTDRGLRVRARRAATLAAAVAATAAAGIGMTAGSATAIEFDSFDVSYNDPFGQPVRQAGSHPDVRVKFTVPADPPDEWGNPGKPYEQFHQIRVDMPRGLVGDPTNVDQCPETGMAAGPGGVTALCPPTAQIGYARVLALGTAPVYNLVPPRGTPGLFAFTIAGVIVKMYPTVRAGDYGITIDTGQLSNASPLQDSDITLWGVPADPSHDPERFDGIPYRTQGHASQAARRPFLTLPTSCSGVPEAITGHIDGWRSIGRFDTRTITSDFDGLPLTLTGCDRLLFEPSISVRAATKVPNAPSGVDVDLVVPQSGSPDGTATAHVKDVTVALPEGLSISPSAANGLTACSDAQLAIGTDAPETCPRSSTIGTVVVQTPLLSEPLTGSVYVGSQESGDPQSGKMFRTFIVASSVESGVRIKLEGAVRPNESTGQLTATFANNPQLPFDELNVQFFDGAEAVLATPETCGAKTTTTSMMSWAGKAAAPSSAFGIDCVPGLGAFRPSFSAGSQNAVAGQYSPLSVAVSKSDLDSVLTGLRMRLPDGLTARLAGSEGTQVGTAVASAGPGSTPFRLPGRVFLEGAYGDAPFSLRVVVPAKAGPFDLGEVVVRQRIYVDRATARVSVVSDPFPTIVKGVPVRLQRIDVKIDKPGFMVNPTSCERKAIDATLSSPSGATADQSVRFQVGDCGSLPFKPRMTFKVGSRGKTSNGKRTPFEARLWMTPGQANNRSIEVTLPKTLNARLDVVDKRTACTIEQFNADRCPQVVGVASAVTPLLKDPLRGAAYFVYNPARRLPDLVVRLKGQVNVDLVGKVTITRALELQTTFDTIPDVPITQFQLSLMSGPRNGPIGVTRNLCAASTRKALAADLAFTAQSNKKISRAQKISVAGCGKASRASGRRAGKGRRASKAKRAGNGGRAGK